MLPLSTDAEDTMQVTLSDYNPDWPRQFSAEQSLLTSLLDEFCQQPIEHVGSTAVPGLAAKPIIDIMVPIQSLAAARPAIELLEQADYCYYPYKADVMHWFCKPSPEFRTHHLHLVPYQSQLWKQRIGFRDLLRNHPDLASQYQALKYQLAEQYSLDREAYTQQKGPFIHQVLQQHGLL